MTQWLSSRVFNWVHSHNLIYNTCWEDPRLDRQALRIQPDDTIMVITSAGCNTLDYLLEGPREIHAVDLNYRQNALLELKLAGIKRLDFDSFFRMFGAGHLPGFHRAYEDVLRDELSPMARRYWDERTHFFEAPRRSSFYFHGTSGWVAWLANAYLDRRPRLREGVDTILSAEGVEQQQAIYNEYQNLFWNPLTWWLCNRDFLLAMMGVPRDQRRHLESQYQGRINRFIQECVEAVFARLPIGDNYFWRLYLTGRYTQTCCPEYLKRENFERLQGGLVERVRIHTDSVTGFLRQHHGRISKFVLLDHMDWLSAQGNSLLREEWQALVDRAALQTRLIWRSGGPATDFVDPIQVRLGTARVRLDEILAYERELANGLHAQDRVHTYGSFHIANLATA